MQMQFKGEEVSRTVFATRVINRVIDSIIQNNYNGMSAKDRCSIVAIGYSDEAQVLCSGLLSHLDETPLRIETVRKKVSDGAGGLVEIQKTMPIWVEPSSGNRCTNMTAAFEMAKQVIEKWLEDKPESPAPVIINISDGIPYYDYKNELQCMEETAAIVQEIMNIHTKDGNVLVFNAEIGESNTQIILPNSEAEVAAGGIGAKFLYEISSEVPDGYIAAAQKNQLPVKEHSRCAVFAADAVNLIKLIDFGSTRGQS